MPDDLHALAAAYALDALDPLERRRFEAHYPECDSCRDEVAGFRETAARLGASEPAPLPPDLKARVMAEVATTRQLPPRVDSGSEPRRTRRVWVAASAAVVVLALAGIGVAVERTTERGVGQELAQVLAEPDAVTVQLDGDGVGTLRVVYSASRDRAVLVGSDLDSVDGDRTYQLWAIRGTEPSSAGVFRPSADGEVESSVTPPEQSPDAWAVTVEPDGGSPAPTSDIVFQGSA